jgi:putative SOS response-associated peptidase YedK
MERQYQTPEQEIPLIHEVMMMIIRGRKKKRKTRKRWLDDAEHDLQQLGVRNWRLKARDRVRWRTV